MSSPKRSRSEDMINDVSAPPLKKQKIEENSKSTANDCDKMELDPIEETKKENNALILFAGSLSHDKINHFCSEIIEKNEFQIIQRQEIETKRSDLENLFFDCDASTIDICDIIKIGMFDEFVASKLFSVMLVSHKSNTDIFYQKLNILTQSYASKQALNKIYVTLNYSDYLYKYQLLFHSNTNNCIQFQSDIDNNIQNIQNIQIEMRNETSTMKCCCTAISMYSNPNYTQIYDEHIKRYGINTMAKYYYHRAIEREISPDPDHKIMDTMWSYLGNVVHYKIDKYQVINYQCYHCNKPKFININIKLQGLELNVLYLKQYEMQTLNRMNVNHEKQNTNKKSKKKAKLNVDTGRHCEICNVSVPSADKNWLQHVNGKKHKKKLLKQKKSA